MNIIVLHDNYSKEPIVVKPNAISVIQKIKPDEADEFSRIYAAGVMMEVKETIGTVIAKIKEAENEE